MSEKWEELKNQIVGVVEARTKDFLAQNANLKALLLERAERLAKLSTNYLMTSDPGAKKDLLDSMEIVQQTMSNEIDAAAANATAAAKGLFKQVIGVAFETLIKVLPSLI
jgi:hypothetical protein